MSKLTATTAMLMTPEEKALFRASESRLLPKVEGAKLRLQIESARHLRKKYNDLLERERATAQAEGAEPGSRAAKGNSNTVRKATAFTYVVANFEAESDRRAGKIVPADPSTKSKDEAAKAMTPSKKKSSSNGTSATKPKASAVSASKKPTAPTTAARGSKAQSAETGKSAPGTRSAVSSSPRSGTENPDLRAKQSGLRQKRGPAQRQVGHAAARGRRQQARSDSRN